MRKVYLVLIVVIIQISIISAAHIQHKGKDHRNAKKKAHHLANHTVHHEGNKSAMHAAPHEGNKSAKHAAPHKGHKLAKHAAPHKGHKPAKHAAPRKGYRQGKHAVPRKGHRRAKHAARQKARRPAKHAPAHKAQHNVNQPSLDQIHDQVHHSKKNKKKAASNGTHIEAIGPSLNLIDAHPHSHDEKSSIVESVKHLVMQPSLDLFDAQLHGGDDHVHGKEHGQNRTAADLNDFKRWIEAQNHSNQLTRFLTLQNEMNRFHLPDSNNLNKKLNRTIEELKTGKRGSKFDL